MIKLKYKIYSFEKLESTNDKAKEIARDEKEGTVIIAKEQTKGRGRLGRTWHSPRGKSILMSIILKPNMEPKDMQKIVLIGAAAVNMALKDIGIESQIKWPNDIIVQGKKVCGILTEMSSNFNGLNYVIIGIGININQDIEDIPKELKEKSTSLKLIKNKEIHKEELLQILLNRFKELYMPFKNHGDIKGVIDICGKNSAIIGKNILVIQGDNIRKGKALDINMEGELLVEFSEGIERVYSGEVSIRGLEGYI